MFIPNYRFDSFQLDLNRKLYTCRKKKVIEKNQLWSLEQKFDCPNIAQEVHVNLIHPKNRTQFIWFLQYSFLLLRSQRKTQSMCRSAPLKNFQLCSVVRNFGSPKIPENAKNFDLSQSSNSNFLLATGLISSLTVSMENLNSVQEDSYEKPLFCGSARNFGSPMFPKDANSSGSSRS